MANCSNAFNHECEKPAVWAGTHETGCVRFFCDDCRKHGHEARAIVKWEYVPSAIADQNDLFRRAIVCPRARREMKKQGIEGRTVCTPPSGRRGWNFC